MEEFERIRQKGEELKLKSQQFIDNGPKHLEILQTELQTKFNYISAFSSSIQGQMAALAQHLKNEEIRMKQHQKAEEEMDNWQHLRAMHLHIQKEKNKQLRKTLEVLKKDHCKMDQHIHLMREENYKIDRAEEKERQQQHKVKKKKELTNLTNRPLQKGIESNLEEGWIKLTVERESKEDISVCGMVEYTMKVEKGRYKPAKQYPEPIRAAIQDFNFHQNIAKLNKDLTALSAL